MRVESQSETGYLDMVSTKNENQKSENINNHEKNKAVIFAGNLNFMSPSIEDKKKQAQSMALGLVSEAFANDSKIDQDMADRSSRVDELRDENQQNRKVLEDISKEKDNLNELYGVTEEDDLSALSEDARKEYISQKKELNANEKEYQKKITDNTKELYENVAILKGTRIERLKSHEMVDVVKQGEQIKEAASKEVIGMMMEQVKDNIDDKTEEEKEQAEEEQKKEEELAQNQKQDKTEEENQKMYELEETLQDIKQSSNGDTLPDVKKSLNQIVNELKLTAEDLKGAVVDENR